jgi:hypothetical protein
MRIGGFLADGLWLLLVVFLLPVAILAVGAPIALAIRAIIEIVHLFT